VITQIDRVSTGGRSHVDLDYLIKGPEVRRFANTHLLDKPDYVLNCLSLHSRRTLWTKFVFAEVRPTVAGHVRNTQHSALQVTIGCASMHVSYFVYL
jgi:hypothetical protein